MPSVVVPAHNEERVLGRLLAALLDDADDLDITVVANGCTDTTAEVAVGFPGVRVLEIPTASKSLALRLGDEAATGFPRLYVDADIIITAAGVRELCEALTAPGILAAGPERVLPMDGVARLVRWYYDVWQRLPVTRDELFGRGVVAVSEEGRARLTSFFSGDAHFMSDDLVMAMSFSQGEWAVVRSSHAEIRPPRTYADLLRRRVRAMTGNAQLDGKIRTRHALRRAAPSTGLRQLLDVVAGAPGLRAKITLIPKVGVFMITALGARLLARRASRSRPGTWLRDDSSRT